MLITARRARTLSILANNKHELYKLAAIAEEINRAIDKGEMCAYYHERIPKYIKEKLEAFGYTIYEQTDFAPDGEFRGYITYIKW